MNNNKEDVRDDVRDDVRGRIDALVAVGRAAEARAVARTALEADGRDAGLFLSLARAHMAEDDDDHDDAAERVFREGLDAFPDDVGLLAGYAELCTRTDALDRPGRHARGRSRTPRPSARTSPGFNGVGASGDRGQLRFHECQGQ
ncbi:hypothetical protein [Streptomyces sp. NBC_00691]|uniref:hypothetical protein n=1 Tax=Streptomyces sp. NBC_00691 TaxID=2903671 RepID=UPI002E302B8A|nr:hypothetical protein [Streptomyces sp. NBC_00691]